jgi:hypothetical protein
VNTLSLSTKALSNVSARSFHHCYCLKLRFLKSQTRSGKSKLTNPRSRDAATGWGKKGHMELTGPALIAPVQAADMPLKAPRVAETICNWISFYISAQGGFARGNPPAPPVGVEPDMARRVQSMRLGVGHA